MLEIIHKEGEGERMSANNQVLVKRVGKEWCGWYDGCVDNEFDSSQKPDWKATSYEHLIKKIQVYLDANEMWLEYGINIIEEKKKVKR